MSHLIIAKTCVRFSLFGCFVLTAFFSKNALAAAKPALIADETITSVDSCSFDSLYGDCQITFGADNVSLTFGSGGGLNLFGKVTSFNSSSNPTLLLNPPENGVLVGDVSDTLTTDSLNTGKQISDVLSSSKYSGINITIDTGDANSGIISTKSNKNGVGVRSLLGSTIRTLEVKSGIIKNDDTAVFLTDSDAVGTEVIVREGAKIEGSRYAIRTDILTNINQVNPSSGASFDEQYAGLVDYTNFDGAVKNGDLKLSVKNYGTISSNPLLNSQPSVFGGVAFYLGSNNRIEKNITISNEETGKIYGSIMAGTMTFDSAFKTKNYIKSEVTLENRGLISGPTILSDFTTKLTITNHSTGIIRIEGSRLDLDGVEQSASVDGIEYKAYTDYRDEKYSTLGDSEKADFDAYDKIYSSSDIAITSIRFQSPDDSLTNYGTIIGNINSSLDTQKIDLLGGSNAGRITFAGSLSFGDNLSENAMSGTIESMSDRVSEKYNAVLNIGSNTYTVGTAGGYEGTLKLVADEAVASNNNTKISTTFTNNGAFGKMNFVGSTRVDTNVKLNINIGDSYSYLTSGTDYVIINGDSDETGTITGSNVKKIDDGLISVNNVLGNTRGILTFHTKVLDEVEGAPGTYHDLAIYFERLSAEEFTDDELTKKVYDEIGEIGSNATGTLKEFQKYIDTSSSIQNIVDALKSAGPVNQGNIEFATMVPINNLIRSVDSRIDLFVHSGLENVSSSTKINGASNKNGNVYAGQKSNSENQNYREWRRARSYALQYCLNLKSDHDKKPTKEQLAICPEGDEQLDNDYSLNESIWGQVFGTDANRNDTNYNGYGSQTSGLAFGLDHKINDNSLTGLALSYANSRIKATNKLKLINLDTYQASLYGGQFFENKIFWEGIAGFAWNEYRTVRFIPSVNQTAFATYRGQNYIGKLRSGISYNKVRNSNFDIIPEISTTFVNTRNRSYIEKGADTLSLNVRKYQDNYLEGRVGINLNYDKTKNDVNNQVKVRSHFSYGYNFLNKQQKTTSSFVGQTSEFSISSTADNSALFRVGLGADLYKKQQTTFSLDYVSDFTSGFVAHSGMAKVTHEF